MLILIIAILRSRIDSYDKFAPGYHVQLSSVKLLAGKLGHVEVELCLLGMTVMKAKPLPVTIPHPVIHLSVFIMVTLVRGAE